MNTRVLISDDEQGICHILRHELEQVGFLVSVSNNGKQTKQFLDEQNFDVLLLDIQMPGCDGFQVLDHLKTVRKKPVIIMMTAYGSIESAVKAMQLGASDYITKPFDVSQLLVKINRLLPSHQFLHKREGDDQTPAFWGSSPQVNEIRNTIEKIKNLKCTHYRRKRHRKGRCGQSHPFCQQPGQGTFCSCGLRVYPAHPN